MPVSDPRGDAGRWANVSYRVRQPNAAEPAPRRRKQNWFHKFCRCCAGQRDDSDWTPAPGEIPGARRTDPVIREGMLVIKKIDLMNGRMGANRRAHHTDEYEWNPNEVGQLSKKTQWKPFLAKKDLGSSSKLLEKFSMKRQLKNNNFEGYVNVVTSCGNQPP
ncbi:hypothetical protein E2320_003626 [Naja naja]|nr:hypothetical protein E2320_003626 [Naja naja]